MFQYCCLYKYRVYDCRHLLQPIFRQDQLKKNWIFKWVLNFDKFISLVQKLKLSIEIIIYNFNILEMCLNSYSITNNLNNLVENPKTDDFIVFNGFKFIGLLGVMIGHRAALDLGAPTLSTEFSNRVWRANNMITTMIFFFIYLLIILISIH